MPNTRVWFSLGVLAIVALSVVQVMYLEPFQVERIGRGDPWGHVVSELEDPGGWMYYLGNDSTWDAVPKVSEQ